MTIRTTCCMKCGKICEVVSYGENRLNQRKYNEGGKTNDCHQHHRIPKRYGGTDLQGKFWLCEPCHVKFERFIEELTERWLKNA